MARIGLGRVFASLACALAVVLAGCGASTIESTLVPTRVVSFGDGFSDLGQGGTRYTVNDGTASIWMERISTGYGLTATAAVTGGTGYAQGNARVIAKPDAAGEASTRTLREQIDAFLATKAFAPLDVVTINGGISDIVAEMAAVQAGSITEAQMLINVRAAGRELGNQTRRMVNAGAKYVLVAGVYNLGKSPWATSIAKADHLQTASIAFNEGLLVSIVDLGANVLYVDTAQFFNGLIAVPATYNLTDATTVVCTSIDLGNGIGIGINKVNSAKCTTTTITAGLVYNNYVFADAIYMTPFTQRQFGDFALTKLRARW